MLYFGCGLWHFFGGASAFAESTLAQVYKSKDDTGGFKGGPAYYIKKSLRLTFFWSFFLLLFLLLLMLMDLMDFKVKQ